jgi:phosphoserine phosphatase
MGLISDSINSSHRTIARRFIFMALLLLGCAADSPAQSDGLRSWTDGPTKRAILDFVSRVTKEGGPDLVPQAERIATFDNDGTLWIEQPMYVQLRFTIDRVKTLAPKHPEWKVTQPFQAALEDDFKSLGAAGEKGLMELLMSTHAGITSEEFTKIASEWISSTKDTRFNRPYTECVYQPMLELLTLLRSKGFKTYIVSGGGVEFMRVFAERVYGIPPEQVIGSTIKTKFELTGDTPVITRLPAIDFIDDKEGKAIAIERIIGRRPIAAFGNSDGDLPMLQWTAAGSGLRFLLLVHHDDGDREFGYDRESAMGRLDVALDYAHAKGWIVVSMKNDWKTILPPRR